MTLPMIARIPCASAARNATSRLGSKTAPYISAVVVPDAAMARNAAGATRSAVGASNSRSSGKM